MKLIHAFLIFALATPLALASPGAHGPNGEHLDVPAGHVRTDSGPHIDTFTESFELVGHLQDGKLSMLIDRYESNEPVLNGKLEVEFNGMKAPARFHADQGSYAVDDEEFLKALSEPGKHALIFTLTAGEESDLLEGSLVVSRQGAAHGHSRHSWPWIAAGAIFVILLLVLAARTRRHKSPIGK
jgi:hypothetical protein